MTPASDSQNPENTEDSGENTEDSGENTGDPAEKSRGVPWMLLLRVVAVLGSIGVVLLVVDVAKAWQAAQQISLPVVALALSVNLVRQGFIAWRWKAMNTAEGTHSLSQYLFFILASRPASLLPLPGLLGFDLARGAMIGQSSEEDRAEQFVSVISDRVVGLSSVILIGMAAALVAPQFPSRFKYVGILGLLLSAFVAGLLVSGSPALHGLVGKLLTRLGGLGAKVQALLDLWMRVVAFFRRNPRRIGKALLACALIHVSWFLIVWLLANNLGLGLSFWVVTTVTALSWIVLALPLSWMGLGVNELSFIFLLSFQGVSAELATALSLHQFAINVMFSILCIPLLLFVGKRK